jgi:hypothetical protein
VIANLQNLAATGPGYYDQSAQMHPGAASNYGNIHHNGHSGYYAPQPQHQQPGSYGGGPQYYPVSHGGDLGQHATYDNRKRGYEALNNFFGDVKRGQIDPTSYHQVGQKLMALQGIPIGGGMSDYMSGGPAMVAVDGHGGGGGGGGGHRYGGQMPSHHYALPPMPNLRTKNDLMNIDQFLEQMQSTTYESANAAAAAGIQQPGTHYTHTGINFRQSHSPPQTVHNLYSHSSAHQGAPMMATHSSQSNSSGTPALTPPSSSVSYTSGHSPTSSNGMSPSSRHSSAAAASYPTLPAVTMGYSPTSQTAPTSTLGTNFDSDQRRRYSGGMLQRSAPHGDMMDLSSHDGSRTPTPKETTPRPENLIRTDISNNIDPALSGIMSPSEQSEGGDSARDRAEEAWIENIRVIEALRRLIQERLERKEYDDEEDDIEMSGTKVKMEGSSENLYPTLRTDED